MPITLRVEAVSKTFPASGGSGAGGDDVVALAGVDLRVAAGEFVAIVGPNGCGKSTLLEIIAGLLTSDGRVELDGDAEASRLGRVGLMPQRDCLMPWRTVRDNVAVGLEVRGVPRRVARERADAELARFGLGSFADHWPAGLSGGMRQRAALLRTFLTGGELLLLDEPFAALDAFTRREMQSWLLDVWGADRPTIILVTHDVEEAIFLADRVCVLTPRPGRITLEVAVPLTRPREPSVVLSPAFTELKHRVLQPLLGAGPGAGSAATTSPGQA